MSELSDFDLSTRTGRYRARRAGFDVPKRKPGMAPRDFDSLVDRIGDCWLWTGPKNADGYGEYCIDGGRRMAHRVAWERLHGPIPAGMVLMHQCDVPACCNPNHLQLGTQAQNIADKVGKGRQARGERSAQSVLTEDQVREMRDSYRFRKVTYKALAERYRVSKDTVQKAVRAINWKHL